MSTVYGEKNLRNPGGGGSVQNEHVHIESRNRIDKLVLRFHVRSKREWHKMPAFPISANRNLRRGK